MVRNQNRATLTCQAESISVNADTLYVSGSLAQNKTRPPTHYPDLFILAQFKIAG